MPTVPYTSTVIFLYNYWVIKYREKSFLPIRFQRHQQYTLPLPTLSPYKTTSPQLRQIQVQVIYTKKSTLDMCKVYKIWSINVPRYHKVTSARRHHSIRCNRRHGYRRKHRLKIDYKKYTQFKVEVGKGLQDIITTQQQVRTIKNPQIAPAVPTTHVNRMNNITPNIFWMHGKKTPINVPEEWRFIISDDK